MSRRALLGGIVALPAAAATPAFAQDLLDPTAIGSSRVGAPSPPMPSIARPAGWRGPDYASGMSSSVTSALISLVRAYGGLVDQVGKLQAEGKDLSGKRDAAVRDKASKLDEYRQGLFCSGCGKTRSEILSRGEQFPHPGQSIIRPTPEQIAAKERELQGIIDTLESKLRDTKAKEAELSPDIDTIRSQLFDGMGLWRSSTGFERRLIRQETNFSDDDYYRQLQVIARHLANARAAADAATTVYQLQRSVGDLEVWIAALEQLQDRRDQARLKERQRFLANEAASRRQVDQVRTVANEVAGRITAFGYAGYLNILTVPMGVNQDTLLISGEATGDTFRMGRYNKEGFGEILPQVSEFLGNVRAFNFIYPNQPSIYPDQELYSSRAVLSRARPKLAAAQDAQERERAEAERRRLEEQAREAEQQN